MTCIHQYGIIQSDFTALKVLHALFIPSFLPPATPAIPDIHWSSVSMVLPFPECHRVGIVQYASWLLPFTNAFEVPAYLSMAQELVSF